jgi:hypothetical protein
MSFDFLKTAPVIKSRRVLEIENTGKMDQLLEAISNERRGKSNTGVSGSNRIKVVRVGAKNLSFSI